MNQAKSSYQRKIDELHQKIEESARDLQKIQEQIETHRQTRNHLLDSVNLLKDRTADLDHFRSQTVKEVKKWQDSRQREEEQHSVKLEAVQKRIKLLEEQEVLLKEKISELKLIQQEIKKKNTELRDIQSGIVQMNKNKSVLANEISALLNQKQLLDKEIWEARGKADIILNSAKVVAQDAHVFYKSIGPYISAISQWHAIHGGEMPELLHDWKPKGILVTVKTRKLLKDKQI